MAEEPRNVDVGNILGQDARIAEPLTRTSTLEEKSTSITRHEQEMEVLKLRHKTVVSSFSFLARRLRQNLMTNALQLKAWPEIA